MSRHAPRRLYHPVVEALEARTLLSVCTVDRLTDAGQGSGLAGDLRYCVAQAQNGDSITFGVTGTINLTRALPNLARSVSIEGPGTDLLTVRRDTGGYYRIFTVAAGARVGISGLTISNGNPNDRGGGLLNAGTLTLSNSIVSGNTAANHLDDGGGGISNSGMLTVSNSIISGNTADDLGGGGIFNNNGTITLTNSTVSGNTALSRVWAVGGGGIYNNGTMTLDSSTISGNTGGTPTGNGGGGIVNNGRLNVINSTISGNIGVGGDFGGGGIFNHVGTLTVDHSTIAGNSTTTRGGGLLDVTGRITIRNTIIAGNTAPSGPDVSGDFGSQGYNLIGNAQGGSGFHPTDLRNVNPRLGSLQDNGGPTRTHALLEGSPAINSGDPAFQPPPNTDQRGLPRVVEGRIDIGAYEAPEGPVALYYVYPDFATFTAGEAIDIAVLALDETFNLVTNYTGEILIITSDEQGTSPAPYRFRPEDGGIAFPGSVTFGTQGLQVLLVFDTATYTVFGVAVFDVMAPARGAERTPSPLVDLFVSEVLSGGTKSPRR